MKRLVSVVLVLALLFTAVTVYAEEKAAKSEAFAGKTLRIVGPGGISSESADDKLNEDGSLKEPGYNKLFAAFLEDYPGVKIEFTPATWTDWTAVLQAAVAGESADVLLHGSMLSDICLDLSKYIEKDPWVLEGLAFQPERYRQDEEKYTDYCVTGFSYTVNPYYALIDLRLLSDWGVEAPDENWTWNDLLKIAQATTGIDPVTGKETYGCYPFKGKDEIRKGYTSYCASQGIENMHYADYIWDVETSFGSAENVAALQYYKDLVACAPASFIEGLGRDKYASAENDLAVFAE